MTEREALKILELSPDAGEREIKTKYRQLIRQVHPDIHGSSEERYTRHAQRINHAYAVLKKGLPEMPIHHRPAEKLPPNPPRKKKPAPGARQLIPMPIRSAKSSITRKIPMDQCWAPFRLPAESICGKQMRIFRYSCSAFTSAAKNCWMKSTWSSAEKNLPRIAGRFTVN